VKENVDLYITGSNAYLLSSEIATLLSGRYVELQLLPLSFKEYVNATGNTNDLERKYADYITFSSFPYAMAFDREVQMTNDYLRGIYSTIVLKDVMHRHSIGDAMMLENVMAFMADNIGNTLSVKKIADTLTSAGRKVDVKTIEKYLSALCQSFILYSAKRYNIKGRQLLKTMEKYYLVDVALRNTLLGSANADFGRMLENVVYLELLRRYPNVYIGKTDAFEIDFVAVNMQEVAYYQVAATVRDEATLERELHPLKMVKDNYPKTILSLDVAPVAYHNGIKIQNVLDWLLEQ
jgi:predicted AAA+ superfamily ATPase